MKDLFSIEGKIALVTGGSRGIGEMIAAGFLTNGAKVYISSRKAQVCDATAARLSKEYSGECISIPANLSNVEGCEQLASEIASREDKLDILINNAALFTAAPIVEIERPEYQRLFDINVSGTLFTLQAVARHMIERGQGGKIINMASQAGRRGEPLVAVYCATKAAVISLTQSAGLDLIKNGINVNAISPGVVDGEHWDGVDAFFAKHENKAPGQKKKEVGAAVPYGRMGTAQDLTGMAVFLASDAADYIVAQTYNVDGGQWMS